MSITLALLLTLAGQCAPTVHPETISAIVKTESDFRPLLIHVNGDTQPSPLPQTKEELVSLANHYIAEGFSVDLGLMQINSNNLEWLGMTIEDTLDPCKNLAAGARILQENYLRAMKKFDEGQPALQAALSAYNTGNQTAGFKNGYVQKVINNSNYKVPALEGPGSSPERQAESVAQWDVFGTSKTKELLW